MAMAKRFDYSRYAAAAEIRSILVNRARRSELITYSVLVNQIRSIRLIARSALLADLLTTISGEEYVAGRGLLSAVVVERTRNGGCGIPGRKFFTTFMPSCKPKDWQKCWRREVDKVFKYWHGRRRTTR
jgi:hypothetical protein